MVTEDWDFGDTAAEQDHTGFGENQVGAVTQTLEPVHASSPVSWVLQQFEARPEAGALPVEKDGGVVGLILKTKVVERSSKFLESLSSRSLDQDMSPHHILDARESVDKVVAGLISGSKALATDHFLVYLNGQYYGVTDLHRLVSQAARLRDLDASKAREFQESTMAITNLPATAWSRAKLVRMAYGVGGDFYQELAWTDGTCFLGCFDVAGKGVAGALVTSALGGFFQAASFDRGPAPAPGEFAARLNDFLRKILPLGTFVAGVLFSLPARPDGSSTALVYNFGYGPVYLFYRKDQKMCGRAIQPQLAPLGIGSFPPETPGFSIPLGPGTKIYTFSDGMSDMVSPSGHRYGDEKIREFLTSGYKKGPEAFVSSVSFEIDSWQGDTPQADDITALTIQMGPTV